MRAWHLKLVVEDIIKKHGPNHPIVIPSYKHNSGYAELEFYSGFSVDDDAIDAIKQTHTTITPGGRGSIAPEDNEE